jgi:hypothetical protein
MTLQGNITGKKTLRMSYSSYEYSVVLKYSVKLTGWPDDVAFQNPSQIGDVGSLQTLRDALKSKVCRWVALDHKQRGDFAAEVKRREESGELAKKTRKRRSDAGKRKSRKDPSSEEEDDGKDGEDEEDEEEEQPRRKRPCTASKGGRSSGHGSRGSVGSRQKNAGHSKARRPAQKAYPSAELIGSSTDNDDES